MSAYGNEVRSYIDRFKREVRDEAVVDPHELAEWAFRNGLIKPNSRTIIDAIAADITQVFREEYRTDRHGRRYRAMHAVKSKRGVKTMSLWADMDDTEVPRDHFVRSFAQRRNQIVGDCVQLKTDVDVYNDTRNVGEPINLVLDFSNDVEELQPKKVA